MGAGSIRRVRRATPGRWLALGLLAFLGACSSGTDPDVKPTLADVRISGSSSVPLRVVVSTDFVEFIDPQTLERRQILNDADTLTVESLPYTDRIPLTDRGSIIVDVANLTDTPATVRLQVTLDSGQDPYDRQATMSQGGALRYVFSYFSPTL